MFFNKSNIFLLTFLISNIFLSSYFLDTWNTPNSVSKALPILTYYENKSLKINNYHELTMDKVKIGESYYSDKAPLPTFIMIPLYIVLKALNINKPGNAHLYDQHPVHAWKSVNIDDGRPYQTVKLFLILLLGSFFIGSLPFAFMVYLTLKYSIEKQSDSSTMVLIMLGWYGSYVFVYSGTFFNHVFAGFLLLASYILLKFEKRYLASGFFAGLSFLTEYTTGVVFVIWPLLILMNEKNFKNSLMFILGILPSLGCILSYNYLITGNALVMLNSYHSYPLFGDQLSKNYGFSISNINLKSIWGLSFSPYMGLFIFSPIILLVFYKLFGNFIAKTINIKSFLTDYLIALSIIYFFLISSFFTWWGGWSLGPRYLIPLSCLLIFEGIRYLNRNNISRLAYLFVTAFGLISSWLSKATLMYMIPDKTSSMKAAPAEDMKPIFDLIIPAFTGKQFNGNSLLSFIVPPGISAAIWLFFFLLFTLLFYYISEKISFFNEIQEI